MLKFVGQVLHAHMASTDRSTGSDNSILQSKERMDKFNRRQQQHPTGQGGNGQVQQWQQHSLVRGENGQVQQTVTIAAVKSCSPSKAWTLRWFSASPHQGGSADLGRAKAGGKKRNEDGCRRWVWVSRDRMRIVTIILVPIIYQSYFCVCCCLLYSVFLKVICVFC